MKYIFKLLATHWMPLEIYPTDFDWFMKVYKKVSNLV